MLQTNNKPKPDVVMPDCPVRQVLKGQKALVTGASSGIGQACAIAFGQAGADVVVNYVGDEDGAEETVSKIKEAGAKGIAIKADVSKEKEVQAMFKKMSDEFGAIDILLSNAGLQKDADFVDLSLEDWNTVIDVNLTGQFLCAREAVRHFIKRGVRKEVSCAAGKIICMSSVHEIIPWAGHVNYAASKGGIKLMMQSIAQEVADQRIRVNSIAPGAIRTPINKDAWETKEAYEELMKLIPYNRIGEVEDVARAAVWLASDESDYVNGITLVIDGGMTLYPGFTDAG